MAAEAAYERPESLAGALALLAGGGWTLLAGGTDLYPATNRRALSGRILDITGMEDLSGLRLDREGLRIGAGTTWAALAAATLPPALAALQAAAREVGGRQIQNAGTIGGNLCNASPAADGLPPLLALEAEVELASQDGIRRLALEDFIAGPRQTALAPGEILVAVHIPRAALMGRSTFLKLGARKYLVISIAAIAVRLLEREGRVALARIAVGACSPVARRLTAVEAALEGASLEDATGLVRDADVAAALAPIGDVRASAAYRAVAAAELVRRAVTALAGGADG
ncbi:FAD binding domain-containing protein [Frigidibacter sp. RF13]|uniref:FAD binding domain-containing protein n=1 Tax=Frigidibacter sp. RF13 TaxID=2997340 RepID=UPI002271B145|nr:FAD binding domain-containing protein [Frigidibacter sp. RF13]MCY1125772.1 FAD binding domain-containing protein [Frigidibacter sp. RF13]